MIQMAKIHPQHIFKIPSEFHDQKKILFSLIFPSRVAILAFPFFPVHMYIS